MSDMISSASVLAMIISSVCTPLFVLMRLGGMITWSWLWVLSPIWLPEMIFAVLLCYAVLRPTNKQTNHKEGPEQ